MQYLSMPIGFGTGLLLAESRPPSREALVRERAYFLWLDRGAPVDDRPEQDWHLAELLIPQTMGCAIETLAVYPITLK